MAEEEIIIEEKTDVDKVNLEYDLLKAANDKVAGELLRGEQLKAKMRTAGEADAGQVEEKPVEETAKEYSDRIDKEISEGKHDD